MDCEHGRDRFCHECDADEAAQKAQLEVDPLNARGSGLALQGLRKYKLLEMFYDWTRDGGKEAFIRGLNKAEAFTGPLN